MTETWSEADSREFLELANVAVPGREEQIEILLDLVPAANDDDFDIVELACGEGILGERLLERYANARWLGLDGSPAMLAAASERLLRLAERAEVREFQFTGSDSLAGTPQPLRCVLSSLAIHHLAHDAKAALYKSIHARLEPGGALIVADAVEPGNMYARRAAVAAWHRIAREQSLAQTGSAALYERAAAEGWAPPETDEPEPGEMPAHISDHLDWLKQAGFADVECFWRRAGIAIYGGYR